MARHMPFSSWRLIGRFVTTRPALTIGALTTIMICAIAEIAFPRLLQNGIDAALGETTGWTVKSASLAMLVVIFVIVIGHVAALIFEAHMVSASSFDLRRRIYSHVQRLPLLSLARHRSGSLAYRTTSDVATLETSIRELFGDFNFDLLVGAGALVAMLATDWHLTLLVVCVMLTATGIGSHLGKRIPTFKRASQILGARLAGVMQESVSAAVTLRAFGAETRSISRLDTVGRKLQGLELRNGLLHALVTPLWHFAEALSIVIVLWYGGSQVAAGHMTVGTLVAFLAYLELLGGPINRFGEYYFQLQSCQGVAAHILTLLEEAPEDQGGSARPQPDGKIVVENLSFRYPGADRPVMQDISFAIEAGEHVAIIGRNGAGKSTLFDLLMRFYLPQTGRIVSGGTDLTAWDPTAWRASVGLMLQETMLLHGTLADNVSIAYPNATREELRTALENAGAASLLARLPEGLETVVGERGQGLSGGERQLIGLARLALRNPAIVLLDEPTAHLDGAALQTVVTAISNFAKGRTMLLITHNPEILRLVGRSIVLEEGRIVAEGNHDTLMASSPSYRRLIGEPLLAQDIEPVAPGGKR